MFSIIFLDPARWQEYKDLRLKALATDPEAFLGTLAEESNLPDKMWKECLEDSLEPDNNVMLFAENSGHIVGMIGILFNTQSKVRHIAKIVSFYVDTDFRSKGIGTALMKRALAILETKKYITKISLTVDESQDAAIKLYTSFGFEKICVLKNNLKEGNKYFNVVIMEKFFSSRNICQ